MSSNDSFIKPTDRLSFTVKILILSRYRYRDAFFEAFFITINEIPSLNLYYFLEIWLSSN
jgi:hypothetical protein